MNLKVHGHALKPPLPINKYRVECSCGAWSTIIGVIGASARQNARKNWHNEHKIAVLRARGKLEDNSED